MDVSWLMKNLNEFVARRANREDFTTGHFWESRFKHKILLDECALITAGVCRPQSDPRRPRRDAGGK